MVPVRNWLWAVGVIPVAVAVACGRGAPDATPQGEVAPQGKSAQTSQPSTAKDACRLIDVAQLETIAKWKFLVEHKTEAEDRTVCELTSAKDPMWVMTVTVYWTGGKEMARINSATMSMAKQMLNDRDTDIEEITGSERVRGLADKAYYSDLMPPWLLKGDVLIEITVPGVGLEREQRKAIFVSIAKTAISRL